MIIPWRVDVPQERLPAANWLIILTTVIVFGMQVRDNIEEGRAETPATAVRNQPRHQPPVDSAPARQSELPPREPPRKDITSRFMLDGWHLKGLLGYMWLHGGLFHLLGNMWFLWLFGNAVCAKVGNVAYLFLYVTLGVIAAVAQLLAAPGPGLGASGAVFGVVGMYLVFFPQNDITFYWTLRLLYWHEFTASGFWLVLFWALWSNLLGLFFGVPHVAYYAHLGGFAAGLAMAFGLCQWGWIRMERYETSLLQLWNEWRHGRPAPAYDSIPAEVTRAPTAEEPPLPLPPPTRLTVPLLDLKTAVPPSATDAAPIVVPCSCGHTIRVSRRYEGKLVRCPRCQGTVRIPRPGEVAKVQPPASAPSDCDQSHADGYIHFSCRCGQAIRVPGQHAGRSGVCPQCGARLRIPEASA